MPPYRYLRGFTLCVPLPEESGSVIDAELMKLFVVKAEVSVAADRALDLVIRVVIRLGDTALSDGGEACGADCFPTEIYVFPFPATRAERHARIRDVVAKSLSLEAVQ